MKKQKGAAPSGDEPGRKADRENILTTLAAKERKKKQEVKMVMIRREPAREVSIPSFRILYVDIADGS